MAVAPWRKQESYRKYRDISKGLKIKGCCTVVKRIKYQCPTSVVGLGEDLLGVFRRCAGGWCVCGGRKGTGVSSRSSWGRTGGGGMRGGCKKYRKLQPRGRGGQGVAAGGAQTGGGYCLGQGRVRNKVEWAVSAEGWKVHKKVWENHDPILGCHAGLQFKVKSFY